MTTGKMLLTEKWEMILSIEGKGENHVQEREKRGNKHAGMYKMTNCSDKQVVDISQVKG